MNNYLQSSIKLHQHIVRHHWDGRTLSGPDPIGKINWRVTRFLRSYSPFISWKDFYIFPQGLGYWIHANLTLNTLTDDASYSEYAKTTADYLVETQRNDGGWNYTNYKERRNRISAVEGGWAGLGLLAAYRKFENPAYLESAMNWYECLVNKIGFIEYKNSLAVNFFNDSDNIIPNATTISLWFMAEIAGVSGDDKFLNYADKLVSFLSHGQMYNGEFEYRFQLTPHFMCFQYNAYQFLDLAHYYELTQNRQIIPILEKSANYLATGVTKRGSAKYDDLNEDPEVNYWTGVMGHALLKAHKLQLGDYIDLSEKIYGYLLSQQNSEGRFGFSKRNYRIFADMRSYPRSQAMILSSLTFRALEEA